MFLDSLSQARTVTEACRLAQLSKQAAFKWRRRDHAFAWAWHVAQLHGNDEGKPIPTKLDIAVVENAQVRKQLELEEEAVWRPFGAKLKSLREGFTPPSVNGSRPRKEGFESEVAGRSVTDLEIHFWRARRS